MNKQYDKLMEKVIELLESGDDTGCDDLVVVGRTEFMELRKIVEDQTGKTYGCVDEEEEEDDDEEDWN